MTDLKNVQWLTVKEAAELWAPELKIPASTIEREIRIALYKLSIKYPFHKNIEIQPKEEDLPSSNQLINQQFILDFSDKESWKLPDFWFKNLPKGPSFPGRPSVMSAIVQELNQVAQRGDLSSTIAEQSRRLETWAKETFRNKQVQTPKARAIENGIRSVFKMLKSQAH